MSIGNKIKKKFATARTRLGELVGRPYDIYRPNYNLMTLVLSEEVLPITDEDADVPAAPPVIYGESLFGRRKFHMEPWGPKFAEPDMNNCHFFSLFGSISGLRFGDVLVDPEGLSPTMTLTNFYEVKEIVAVRTHRIGQICDDVSTVVVPAIRYEWLKYAAPAAGFTDLLAPLVSIPSKKIVVYERPELMYQNFSVQGKRLLENDGFLNPPRRWLIKLVEYIRPLIILTVEEED
jgi:hypothetical protein